MKKLLMVFVCALAVLAPSMLAAATHPEVGTLAPQFTLVSQDGTPVSLKDFRGRWVVLYFYPKDFTSGCTLEAHNFQRDVAEYDKHNAVILGVSLDDQFSHNGFCRKEGITFKLLADTGREVSRSYGTLTEKSFPHAQRHTFLITPQGTIALVWEDVKPNEHSAQVLAALSELQKN